MAYERKTKPLTDYYRRRGVYEVVDGSIDVEEVGRALNAILKCAEERDGYL